ncbi:TPA: HPr family phosphocarrier protein [bacterium]|nr:HPr family phosphocarrier protein [bacterium]
MKTQTYRIKDMHGLNSRASASVVAEANRYKSTLTLKYNDEEADLKSIMNVMALVIRCGEEFSISAEGVDEEAAINGITKHMEEIGLI